MKRKLYTMCIAMSIGLSVLSGCGSKSYMQSQQSVGEAKEETKTEKTKTQETQWIVQLEGAVVHPGVYELAPKSRVCDAVELAGGLTEEADRKALNQARALKDGELIYVKAIGESSAEDGDERVNINTATVKELTSLSGIGETRAQTIVDYRESNGLFSVPEDLKKVSGIGDSTYNKIKDAIRVD